MRHLYALALALLTPALPAAAQSTETLTGQCDLVERPDITSTRLAGLFIGNRVTVLDRASPGWVHVSRNGQTGYVMSVCLEPLRGETPKPWDDEAEPNAPERAEAAPRETRPVREPRTPATPRTAPTARRAAPAGMPSCAEGGDCDCADLTRDQAQRLLASDPGDPHRLDRDGDGLACETSRRSSATRIRTASPRRATPARAVTRSGPQAGYYTGPRGGCYTYTASGRKRYVDHSYCGR